MVCYALIYYATIRCPEAKFHCFFSHLFRYKTNQIFTIFLAQTHETPEEAKEGHISWCPWAMQTSQRRHFPCLQWGLWAWRRRRHCTVLCSDTTFLCHKSRGPAVKPQFLIKRGYYIVPSSSTALPLLHVYTFENLSSVLLSKCGLGQ